MQTTRTTRSLLSRAAVDDDSLAEVSTRHPEDNAMPVGILALFAAIPVVGLTATFVYMMWVAGSTEPGDSGRALPWDDVRDVGYWLVVLSLAVVYVVAAVPKLAGYNDALHQFEQWGYPGTFVTVVGAVEFVSAIFLVIPATARYAAAALSLVMVGAIYTHLAFGLYSTVLLPATCLAFLAFVGFASLHRESDLAEGAEAPPPADPSQAS